MKKLLNKKGSVLFLVVVVMSILLVVASATYYIVSNQRQSVEVHYNSEQSYQTAYSVSRNVSDYIDKTLNQIQAKPDLYNTNNIAKKMLDELTVGGTSLKATPLDLSEAGLGNDVQVEIEKFDVQTDEDGREVHYFNVITTCEVNGEIVRLAQVKTITRTIDDTKYFTRFLTCTGKRPEDVSVTAADIYGDAYFENDFTRLGNPDKMQRSLHVSGTLVDTGMQFPVEGLELAVGKNMYIDDGRGEPWKLKSIFIGGDFIDKAKQFVANETYVLGDLDISFYSCNSTFFVQEDCYINSQGTSDSVFYINGDLHLGENGDCWNSGTFYVKGDVYLHTRNVGLKDKIRLEGDVISTIPDMPATAPNPWDESAEKWKNDHTIHVDNIDFETPLLALSKANGHVNTEGEEGFMTFTDVANYISSAVSKGSYQDWNADDYFDEHYSESPVIKLDSAGTYGTQGSKVQLLDEHNGHYRIDINESCTIQPADWVAGGGRHYIIVDTEKAEARGEKAVYIKLDPNNASKMFCFSQDAKGSYTYFLVKGKLPVILILPDDADFQMETHSFIGHLDVALQLSGCTDVDDMINRRQAVYSDFQKNMSGLLALLKDDPDLGLMIDRSKFRSGLNPHNNIFFVTNGSENTLHFDKESCFCGYIYAPNSYLDSKNPEYQGLAFVGGLIAGSYSYNCIGAQLVFIHPYDEYGGQKENIVSSLISQANGGPATPAPTSDKKVIIEDHKNLGYR